MSLSQLNQYITQVCQPLSPKASHKLLFSRLNAPENDSDTQIFPVQAFRLGFCILQSPNLAVQDISDPAALNAKARVSIGLPTLADLPSHRPTDPFRTAAQNLKQGEPLDFDGAHAAHPPPHAPSGLSAARSESLDDALGRSLALHLEQQLGLHNPPAARLTTINSVGPLPAGLLLIPPPTDFVSVGTGAPNTQGQSEPTLLPMLIDPPEQILGVAVVLHHRHNQQLWGTRHSERLQTLCKNLKSNNTLLSDSAGDHFRTIRKLDTDVSSEILPLPPLSSSTSSNAVACPVPFAISPRAPGCALPHKTPHHSYPTKSSC
ncbi:hypothetical protein PtA15_5A304 [Puccinia triticina]|uniref:Uncharacterized protein n=1 Tax=Puccinia triticina TaxID=208348 RepID=A0ABY7CKS3_9BASI|nr:uncharacterized protein PtA15_5A304 [Puccinia triticina]WAQ84731.1 hypothetical protein PtA15_5A304 [Puccinia triticina]